MTRKADEIDLMRAALEQPSAPAGHWREIDGMHEKRWFYLLTKWARRGWVYEYGWSGQFFELTGEGLSALWGIVHAHDWRQAPEHDD